MTSQLYKKEKIERTVVNEVKVFYSIDSLILYIKEEYCPAHRKTLAEPFGECDTINDLIKAQIEMLSDRAKDDPKIGFKRWKSSGLSGSHGNDVVAIKVPFNDHDENGKWTGSSIQKFFVDGIECLWPK